MPKRLFICVCCSVMLFSGCWRNSSDTQTLSFDGFSIDISTDFTKIAKGLVENKQIVNKILHSYKIDGEEWFDTNFIITKSELPPSLDYEQFRTVNTNKLKQYVQWYTPGEKQLIDITCWDDEIRWMYVTFSVRDSLMQKWATYYMAQYQFVYNDIWYIISYATVSENLQDNLKDDIENITCK